MSHNKTTSVEALLFCQADVTPRGVGICSCTMSNGWLVRPCLHLHDSLGTWPCTASTALSLTVHICQPGHGYTLCTGIGPYPHGPFLVHGGSITISGAVAQSPVGHRSHSGNCLVFCYCWHCTPALHIWRQQLLVTSPFCQTALETRSTYIMMCFCSYSFLLDKWVCGAVPVLDGMNPEKCKMPKTADPEEEYKSTVVPRNAYGWTVTSGPGEPALCDGTASYWKPGMMTRAEELENEEADLHRVL